MQDNVINAIGVRKMLPYGSIKEIAFRSKTSIYTVHRVLKGGSKNPLVLKTIKDYIIELQQVKNELNALVSESKTSY